ncbi:MAG TPA: hypothetical protein ENI70_01455 [Candidatus Peregrinibacteria bacterium]|nr:hypothetical protein [Candidatus Peregrinibacteria bacterium]
MKKLITAGIVLTILLAITAEASAADILEGTFLGSSGKEKGSEVRIELGQSTGNVEFNDLLNTKRSENIRISSFSLGLETGLGINRRDQKKHRGRLNISHLKFNGFDIEGPEIEKKTLLIGEYLFYPVKGKEGSVGLVVGGSYTIMDDRKDPFEIRLGIEAEEKLGNLTLSGRASTSQSLNYLWEGRASLTLHKKSKEKLDIFALYRGISRGDEINATSGKYDLEKEEDIFGLGIEYTSKRLSISLRVARLVGTRIIDQSSGNDTEYDVNALCITLGMKLVF